MLLIKASQIFVTTKIVEFISISIFSGFVKKSVISAITWNTAGNIIGKSSANLFVRSTTRAKIPLNISDTLPSCDNQLARSVKTTLTASKSCFIIVGSCCANDCIKVSMPEIMTGKPVCKRLGIIFKTLGIITFKIVFAVSLIPLLIFSKPSLISPPLKILVKPSTTSLIDGKN